MNLPYIETQQPELSAEEITRQLELILYSRHFRQARSLEKFLRYVVEKTLAGVSDDLKEFTIGVDVFQRRRNFDPRIDNVVRVQAAHLRKKLAGYYEEEGAADEIIIEMPKGHYVPQFNRRSSNTDLNIAPEEPAAIAPIGAEESLTVFPTSRRFRSRTPVWVAAAFLLGLAAAAAWQKLPGKSGSAANSSGQLAALDRSANQAAIDPVYLPLWEKFLEPGADNMLAYGTPQFFVGEGLYLRDTRINSPQEFDASPRIKMLPKTMREAFKPIEIYTGVGEAHGVHLLTKFFGKLSSDLRVSRSRMVGWNELKNANVIFLSSMRFYTLAKELPYPSDFSVDPGGSSRVFNLRPRAGESKAYGGRDSEAYAVITVWPGKLHQRRILILSGSTTWATLAAAEYVTDPEYLRQLNRHLEKCPAQSRAAAHPPFFQTLVRAEVRDNQAVAISYVTHHDLEIAGDQSQVARR
jgi:hypothetical protein